MGSQKLKLSGEIEIGNHNFLPLTSQITTVESRDIIPPPNSSEAQKKAAPEVQNYLILIHILLAPGVLLTKLA